MYIYYISCIPYISIASLLCVMERLEPEWFTKPSSVASELARLRAERDSLRQQDRADLERDVYPRTSYYIQLCYVILCYVIYYTILYYIMLCYAIL